MAKEYGTPIKPYVGDSEKIERMCDHTGWSKSQMIMHMVENMYGSVMSMQGAPKPGGNG